MQKLQNGDNAYGNLNSGYWRTEGEEKKEEEEEEKGGGRFLRPWGAARKSVNGQMVNGSMVNRIIYDAWLLIVSDTTWRSSPFVGLPCRVKYLRKRFL